MIHEEGRRSACIGICFRDLNVEVLFLNLEELKFWNLSKEQEVVERKM
jgi:hypothetical protein